MVTTVGHIAVLEKVASDLDLDLDGVRTLISELSATDSPDPAYIRKVVQTVNESFARHMVALNEVANAVENA